MIGIFANMCVIKTMSTLYGQTLNGIIDSVGPENAIVIDINTGNKVKRTIGNREDIEYKHIPWKDGYTWKEYEHAVIDALAEVDTLIMVAHGYNDKLCCSTTHPLYDAFEKALAKDNYKYSTTFVSTRSVLQRYVVCKCGYKLNKKLIQYCLDPLECIMTDLFNNGMCVYAFNKGNKVTAPAFEYGTFKKGKYEDKTVDFTFYATCLTEKRKYLIDHEASLTNIKNSDVKIIYDNINSNSLPQPEYYKKLAHSKYTLVIPSYDITTFSIGRFVESIAHRCVPLILNTCDLTDVKNTFPDIYELITKYLVVNIDTIQSTIDSLEYNDIMDKLLNSETVKNWQNLDFYKDRWNTVINMA